MPGVLDTEAGEMIIILLVTHGLAIDATEGTPRKEGLGPGLAWDP